MPRLMRVDRTAMYKTEATAPGFLKKAKPTMSMPAEYRALFCRERHISYRAENPCVRLQVENYPRRGSGLRRSKTVPRRLVSGSGKSTRSNTEGSKLRQIASPNMGRFNNWDKNETRETHSRPKAKLQPFPDTTVYI